MISSGFHPLRIIDVYNFGSSGNESSLGITDTNTSVFEFILDPENGHQAIPSKGV
ncbi:MAG: hypothetical protein CM1200mP3_05040 [Chloroflexota bacterium]|nr:MAG: hypothetical protein CM1200mP3_05040 [Chloroflexota bacterium]